MKLTRSNINYLFDMYLKDRGAFESIRANMSKNQKKKLDGIILFYENKYRDFVKLYHQPSNVKLFFQYIRKEGVE
jgi:hypothetical protein